MSDEPKIPAGYKRVFGHSEKGDGRWNGTRFEKVKKEYPFIREDMVVIRRCEVEQVPLPGVEAPVITPQDVANLYAADAKRLCEQANAAMDEGVDELLGRMAGALPEMEVE